MTEVQLHESESMDEMFSSLMAEVTFCVLDMRIGDEVTILHVGEGLAVGLTRNLFSGGVPTFGEQLKQEHSHTAIANGIRRGIRKWKEQNEQG